MCQVNHEFFGHSRRRSYAADNFNWRLRPCKMASIVISTLSATLILFLLYRSFTNEANIRTQLGEKVNEANIRTQQLIEQVNEANARTHQMVEKVHSIEVEVRLLKQEVQILQQSKTVVESNKLEMSNLSKEFFAMKTIIQIKDDRSKELERWFSEQEDTTKTKSSITTTTMPSTSTTTGRRPDAIRKERPSLESMISHQIDQKLNEKMSLYLSNPYNKTLEEKVTELQTMLESTNLGKFLPSMSN